MKIELYKLICNLQQIGIFVMQIKHIYPVALQGLTTGPIEFDYVNVVYCSGTGVLRKPFMLHVLFIIHSLPIKTSPR